MVTGGADGLGKGIARRLASEGAHVVLFDVSPLTEGVSDRGTDLHAFSAGTVAAFTSEGLAVEGAKVGMIPIIR